MPRPTGGSTNGGYSQKKPVDDRPSKNFGNRRKLNLRDYHGKKIKAAKKS